MDEDIIFTVQAEDGTIKQLTLITVFKAGAYGRDYCACLSNIPNEDGKLPLEIYRYQLVSTGEEDQAEMQLSSVYSEMEYEEAVAALEKLLDDDPGIEAEN